jgi:hypothetical protein
MLSDLARMSPETHNFFFFCIGDWTQGLMHVKYSLYYWATSPAQHCFHVRYKKELPLWFPWALCCPQGTAYWPRKVFFQQSLLPTGTSVYSLSWPWRACAVYLFLASSLSGTQQFLSALRIILENKVFQNLRIRCSALRGSWILGVSLREGLWRFKCRHLKE